MLVRESSNNIKQQARQSIHDTINKEKCENVMQVVKKVRGNARHFFPKVSEGWLLLLVLVGPLP
jgi:hypothetical protein